jgi:hypothetical protein
MKLSSSIAIAFLVLGGVDAVAVPSRHIRSVSTIFPVKLAFHSSSLYTTGILLTHTLEGYELS